MISVLINDHLYSPPQYSNVLFTVQTHKGDLSLVDGILCFHLWWFGKKSGKSQGEDDLASYHVILLNPTCFREAIPSEMSRRSNGHFPYGGAGSTPFHSFWGVFPNITKAKSMSISFFLLLTRLVFNKEVKAVKLDMTRQYLRRELPCVIYHLLFLHLLYLFLPPG